MSVLVVVGALATMAGASLALNMAANNEVSAVRDQSRALYLAEAAVNEALAMLVTALNTNTAPATTVGTEAAPLTSASGSYWADVADNGDGTFTIAATGRVARHVRRIQVVARESGSGVFENAVFARNGSGDPNYQLELRGTGEAADTVQGDIYSGGDVLVEQDATVAGQVRAKGTVYGLPGESGEDGKLLDDMALLGLPASADVDVAAQFAAEATWQADDSGGSAWQLPEDSLAHIFRKNPDDRSTETASTTKDDYYLEDPYEPPTSTHTLTLSGATGKPGPVGNDKLYFIDGNLWIDSLPASSLRFSDSGGSPIRLTFVARGNVYFSDDFRYQSQVTDGVAFIALADPAVPDSGNIYLGDPRAGSFEHLHGFLYAENDLRDFQLDATSNPRLALFGTFGAGNEVRIERDFLDGAGDPVHIELDITYDARVAAGTLTLPGVADLTRTKTYEVVSWREVGGP